LQQVAFSVGDTSKTHRQNKVLSVLFYFRYPDHFTFMIYLITMHTFTNILLAITTFTTALMAGLFYAYSCSVNPGLGRLPDAMYLSAMQSINRAILNPVFFAGFMGALILLPVCTWLHYGTPLSVRFWCLLAATVVYIIGVFGVTVAGNIPLNQALDAFKINPTDIETLARQRAAFEAKWNSFNTIRTVAAIVTVMLTIIACMCPSSGESKN